VAIRFSDDDLDDLKFVNAFASARSSLRLRYSLVHNVNNPKTASRVMQHPQTSFEYKRRSSEINKRTTGVFE